MLQSHLLYYFSTYLPFITTLRLEYGGITAVVGVFNLSMSGGTCNLGSTPYYSFFDGNFIYCARAFVGKCLLYFALTSKLLWRSIMAHLQDVAWCYVIRISSRLVLTQIFHSFSLIPHRFHVSQNLYIDVISVLRRLFLWVYSIQTD